MMWPFRQKREREPMRCISDIVATVLRNHPQDCIFAEGAEDRIIAAARKVCPGRFDYSPALIDAIEAAFKAEEIYCPHEGIDRREEFGLIPSSFCVYQGAA